MRGACVRGVWMCVRGACEGDMCEGMHVRGACGRYACEGYT